MKTENHHYTELDRELQNLASMDWVTFVQLIGAEAITSAKICILRRRGRSLGQISAKLGVTKEAVRWSADNKCNCPTYGKKSQQM